MAKKIRKNILFDELTEKIIKREVKTYGSNQSEVVRRIIIEWDRSNNPETVIIGGNGQQEEN